MHTQFTDKGIDTDGIHFICTDKTEGADEMIEAVEDNNLAMVIHLIKNDAPVNLVNGENMSLLMYAISSYKDPRIVHELVKAATSVHQVGHYTQQPNVAKKLSDAKDQINQPDKKGNTAIMYSAMVGDIQITHMLIDSGADVNQQNEDGTNALMRSSSEGYIKVSQALINAGADVNQEDNQGRTALMHAVVNGETDTVQLLLDAGARTDLKDGTGQTVKDIIDDKVKEVEPAEREKFTEIQNLLNIEKGETVKQEEIRAHKETEQYLLKNEDKNINTYSEKSAERKTPLDGKSAKRLFLNEDKNTDTYSLKSTGKRTPLDGKSAKRLSLNEGNNSTWENEKARQGR